ncbi:MAG: TonB-dependent receptor [Deltaproteobacteria bacterium]|nr:TonB-dependent receptor [Deltaproteobacteria bacterium]
MKLFIILLIITALFSSRSYAGDNVQDNEQETAAPRFELDEIVVTATGIKEPVLKIPRNVTVITSEDIEQATSNNIVDLLSRESGLNLNSFFGSDKRATVDIRGMGATAASNVVVMVDGARLNSTDMAGPDFSSVSLNQVERIEIVRGAGSVLYGNGAVGGAINIITKKGQTKPEARIYSSYGSYDTTDNRGSFRGKIKDLGFNLDTGYFSSKGYRENGYLRKNDVAANFYYKATDRITLSLSGSNHEDRCGLPGPVDRKDMDSRNKRTETNRPDDFGEITDRRVTGGIEIDLDKWGIFNARRGYRFRDNSYIMGYSEIVSEKDQTDNIDEDTKNLSLDYKNEFRAFGLPHNFRCGLDNYKTEYVREELSRDQRKNSEVKNLGLFLTSNWSLLDDLALEWGYRYNKYKGRFRTDDHVNSSGINWWKNGHITDESWINRAYDMGLTYTVDPGTTLFMSYAKSFRIPNVDELALKRGDLKPQNGFHLDAGSRMRFKNLFEISITIFRIKIEDEIYFGEDPDDPLNRQGFNRNYDNNTIRRGVETDLKVYPSDSLYIWGNYSYTNAKFDKKGTYVPLVPKHTANIGVEWRAKDPLLVSVICSWTGSSFDGNDLNNDKYKKLDDYFVFNGKISYKYRQLKVFAGVNNIFDELYSTIAYSNTYYPMPARNFYGGMEIRF